MNTTWIPKTIVCMSAAVGLWACQDSGQSAHGLLLDVGAADVGAVDVADAVDPTATQISISPDPIVLVKDGAIRAEADVRDQAGQPMPATDISWAVRDAAIASVTDDGALVGHQVGETTLFATAGGANSSAAVRVEEVDRVEIVPDGQEVGVGETLALEATIYSAGHLLGAAADFRDNAPVAHWQSTSPEIATVDEQGRLTAINPGEVDISADVAGTVGTATFRIQVKFQSVSCRGFFCCAISTHGPTYCWEPPNRNSFASDYGNIPQKVPGNTRFSSIFVGSTDGSFCGLTEAGQAFCWGQNTNGRLGQPDRTRSYDTPQPVDTEVRFKELAMSQWATCGLSRDDKLYCWGRRPIFDANVEPDFSDHPYLVSNGPFEQLVMAQLMGCVQASDNTWSCMGKGPNSQIFGDGSVSETGLEPMDEPVAFSTMTPARIYSSMCGLGPTGRVYCRGLNNFGSMGQNPDDLNPHQFNDDWMRTSWDKQMHRLVVNGGGGQQCSVSKTHEIVCWGLGDCVFPAGRLHQNTWRLHRIQGLPEDWTDFALQGRRGHVLSESGDVWTWGYQPNAAEASDNAYYSPLGRLCDPTPFRLSTY